MDNYVVKGYDVYVQFFFNEQNEFNQGYDVAHKYIYDNLNKVIQRHEYMKDLFQKRENDSDLQMIDQQMIDHYDFKIALWKNVLSNSSLLEREDHYELSMKFIDDVFKDDPDESRENNDGYAIEYIFDELRSIGMHALMTSRLYEEKDYQLIKAQADYWFLKADNFRIVAIPE